MSPPGRENRPARHGATISEQPGGPRPTLPDPRGEVARHTDCPAWPTEPTMHDVIARALTPVVAPVGEPRSLPDTYQARVRKVLKAIESLERLHADPRFRGDWQEIQDRNLPVVVNHAAAKLNDVRDVLASDGPVAP